MLAKHQSKREVEFSLSLELSAIRDFSDEGDSDNSKVIGKYLSIQNIVLNKQ